MSKYLFKKKNLLFYISIIKYLFQSNNTYTTLYIANYSFNFSEIIINITQYNTYRYLMFYIF